MAGSIGLVNQLGRETYNLCSVSPLPACIRAEFHRDTAFGDKPTRAYHNGEEHPHVAFFDERGESAPKDTRRDVTNADIDSVRLRRRRRRGCGRKLRFLEQASTIMHLISFIPDRVRF